MSDRLDPQTRLLTALREFLPRVTTWPAPWRVLAFVGCLLAVWLPIALVLVLPLVLTLGVADNTTNLVTVLTLYSAILLVIWLWGRWVRGESQPLRALGWVWGPRLGREIAWGVVVAIGSMSILFAIEISLGWLQFVFDPKWQAGDWLRIGLNGLATGIGIAFLEELFFRGWFYTELRWDYGRRWAGIHSSWIFASLHYLKPIDVLLATWPQLPGLTLLGLTMVQARSCGGRDRQGSLGMPIGMHGGWVCAVTIASLSGLHHYTGIVPTWVTGIGGNPLAGVIGFGFLSAVGWGLRQWSQSNPQATT